MGKVQAPGLLMTRWATTLFGAGSSTAFPKDFCLASRKLNNAKKVLTKYKQALIHISKGRLTSLGIH
jgi:hypothetical protein